MEREPLRDQISTWLCDWFLSRRKFRGDVSQLPSINYFDAGLLTSLEVIEFVSEIEEQFRVHFSEQDFQDPRFVTVAGLVELIAERARQATDPR
jgi:methoxymalonate biosynthesis acyl carrier protein